MAASRSRRLGPVLAAALGALQMVVSLGGAVPAAAAESAGGAVAEIRLHLPVIDSPAGEEFGYEVHGYDAEGTFVGSVDAEPSLLPVDGGDPAGAACDRSSRTCIAYRATSYELAVAFEDLSDSFVWRVWPSHATALDYEWPDVVRPTPLPGSDGVIVATFRDDWGNVTSGPRLVPSIAQAGSAIGPLRPTVTGPEEDVDGVQRFTYTAGPRPGEDVVRLEATWAGLRVDLSISVRLVG